MHVYPFVEDANECAGHAAPESIPTWCICRQAKLQLHSTACVKAANVRKRQKRHSRSSSCANFSVCPWGQRQLAREQTSKLLRDLLQSASSSSSSCKAMLPPRCFLPSLARVSRLSASHSRSAEPQGPGPTPPTSSRTATTTTTTTTTAATRTRVTHGFEAGSVTLRYKCYLISLICIS